MPPVVTQEICPGQQPIAAAHVGAGNAGVVEELWVQPRGLVMLVKQFHQWQFQEPIDWRYRFHI
jgi:hypothetical protein